MSQSCRDVYIFLKESLNFRTQLQKFFKDLQFSVSIPSVQNGGGEGNRTHDPLRAKQVLSQLSYTPIFACLFSFWLRCCPQITQSHIGI